MEPSLVTLFPRFNWVVPGQLLAGFYPCASESVEAAGKLQALFYVGVRRIVNLMEPEERDYRNGALFADYSDIFAEIAAEQREMVSCLRFPVRDLDVPDVGTMHQILDAIDSSIDTCRPVYVPGLFALLGRYRAHRHRGGVLSYPPRTGRCRDCR